MIFLLFMASLWSQPPGPPLVPGDYSLMVIILIDCAIACVNAGMCVLFGGTVPLHKNGQNCPYNYVGFVASDGF